MSQQSPEKSFFKCLRFNLLEFTAGLPHQAPEFVVSDQRQDRVSRTNLPGIEIDRSQRPRRD